MKLETLATLTHINVRKGKKAQQEASAPHALQAVFLSGMSAAQEAMK